MSTNGFNLDAYFNNVFALPGVTPRDEACRGVLGVAMGGEESGRVFWGVVLGLGFLLVLAVGLENLVRFVGESSSKSYIDDSSRICGGDLQSPTRFCFAGSSSVPVFALSLFLLGEAVFGPVRLSRCRNQTGWIL